MVVPSGEMAGEPVKRTRAPIGSEKRASASPQAATRRAPECRDARADGEQQRGGNERRSVPSRRGAAAIGRVRRRSRRSSRAQTQDRPPIESAPRRPSRGSAGRCDECAGGHSWALRSEDSGSSRSVASSVSARDGRSNARRPVSSSNRIAPSAKTSARPSASRPRICSGAM